MMRQPASGGFVPARFGLYVAAAFAILACAGFAAASALQTDGVNRATIASSPTCNECRVVFERVVTLGDRLSTPLICGPEANVAVDSRGRFFVAPSCTDGQVVVFAPDGELTTAFSAQPGAHQPARILRLWTILNDNLYVVSAPDIHAVFDSHQRLVRSRQSFPLPFDLVGLANGRTLQQLVIETREKVGLPLHVVESDGKIIDSFGSEDRAYRGDRSFLLYRTLAGRDGASFWVAHFTDYKLERWDLDGVVRDVLQRETDWWAEASSGDRRPPVVQDVRVDEEGRVWVMVIVPLDRWAPADGGEPNEHFRTIVDVIDPVEASLVATTRLEMALGRWVGDDLAYSFASGDVGGMVIHVWRVRLLRP